MTKASSFKNIYSKSIKASKMCKRETICKLLGLLLVMTVALAAWALPLSLHSPTEAQGGSTSISVIPSQVSVDVTQAEFFNVSVWIYDVSDLFAYQVALEVNDSIVSIDRGWVPRENSSWVFHGETTVGVDPAFLDRNEDGRNEWVLIGDSLVFEAGVFTGNGLLAIIELHVERSPATAVLNIDNPPRTDPWSTELLDYNMDGISATRNNGQVQITGEVVEKYPSQITISADPPEATVGEEVVLTGNLSGIKDADVQPIPNADIRLQRSLPLPPVVWVDIGKVKTNATGHFRLVWLTDDTGAIEVRGKWDGDETFKGEVSDAVTVHIIEIVTNLEIVFADPDQIQLGEAAEPLPTVPGTFNVTVMNVTDLFKWKVKIYYDPFILGFDEAWLPADHAFSEKSYTLTEVETGSDEYGSYIILSANLTDGEGFTGDGTLFQMNFTGIHRTRGLPPNYLTFSTDYGDETYTYLKDSIGKNIPFKAKELSVTVEAAPTVISVVNLPHFYVDEYPVGSRFNATIVIRHADSLSGWRVKLSFNNTLISPVNVFHPTADHDYVFYGLSSINETLIEEGYLLLQDTLTPDETPVSVGITPKLLTVVQFEIICAPLKPVGIWGAFRVDTVLNIAYSETSYLSRGYWLPADTENGIYSYSARGEINGTVTDADTTLPLPGAEVSVNGYSDSTDASGFYSINIEARTHPYNVTAETRHYVSDTATGVSVAADETVTVDFSLTPLEVGWINGTVTDAETGLPIEGAWIRTDTSSDVTDASGFYEVKVATGTYEVDAEMQPGYISNMAVGVSVAAGQTATVNLSLSPAMSAVQNAGLPTLKEDGGEFVLQTDSPGLLTYHANESTGFPRDPPPGFTQFGQEGSFEITYSRPAGVSNNESVVSLFVEFDWPYDEPPDRFMGSLSLLVLGSTDDLGELDVQVQVDVYLGRADGKKWRLWPGPTVAGKCNMPIGFIEDVSRRVVDSRTGLVLARFPWKIVYPRSGQQTIDGWIISRDSAASKGGHMDSESGSIVNDFTEFGAGSFPQRMIFTGSGKYVLSLNITFLDQGAPGDVETSVFVDDFGLLMHRPASTWIEGTITDTDTGLPLEGATVSAVALLSSYSGSTDASGFYSFKIGAGLTYDVTAEMAGYISDTVTGVYVHRLQAITAHFSLRPTTIPEAPSIKSCDSTGTCKDVFDLDDTVYVNGSGYVPSLTTVSSYDIYVVNDVAWSDGMPIPARVPGTVTTVTSNSLGNISPTAVWLSPLTPGRYDVIVDVNSNGVYDAEIDALDDNDIEVTAGFFVIPEYLVGTIMSLIGFFMALGLFYTHKRKRE